MKALPRNDTSGRQQGEVSASISKRKSPLKKKREGKTKNTNERQINRSVVVSIAAQNRKDSSLWNLLPTITRALFVEKISESLHSPTITGFLSNNFTIQNNLPLDLHRYIPNMVEFYLQILERQRLFVTNEKPTNRIFRNYHFCNNYRELDRGTAFFRSQVLQLYFDHNGDNRDKQLSQNQQNQQQQRSSQNNSNYYWTQLDWTEQVLALSYHYRLCNRMDSFTHSDNPLLPLGNMIPRLGQFQGEFAAYVRSYKTRKEAFFTAAHQTTNYEAYIRWCQETSPTIEIGEDNTGTSSCDIRQLASEVLDAVSGTADDGTCRCDLRKACKTLTKLNGVRNFYAWQILCDLEEAGCFGLIKQNILYDVFCLLGPGAEHGLERIFGRNVISKVGMTTNNNNNNNNNIKSYSSLQLCKYLRDNIDICLGLVDKSFPYWRKRPVTLKVIEHALCEHDKFIRLDLYPGKELRKRKSVSHLDAIKPCQCCGKIAGAHTNDDDKGSTRCDSCHATFCSDCVSQNNTRNDIPNHNNSAAQQQQKSKILHASNYCRRCYDLDNLQFSD